MSDFNMMFRHRMLFRDGFSMSVQASEGHYCVPRVTGLGIYDAYEVGYPSEAEPLLMPYAENADDPTQMVYGFVPIGIVLDIAAKHGGIAGVANNVSQGEPNQ